MTVLDSVRISVPVCDALTASAPVPGVLLSAHKPSSSLQVATKSLPQPAKFIGLNTGHSWRAAT